MFSFIFGFIINEVMYDPLGNESSAGLYNEAIEIYNPSDTTVCLNGWVLKDRYDADNIIPFPDSTVLESCPTCIISTCLPPFGFGVILDRDYTNPSSPNPTPYSFPSGTVLMSVNDAQLGNGLSQNDTLYLINPYGDTVDMVGPFPTTGDGISAERKSPNINTFFPSRSPTGNTLGFGNSVSCPYEFSISLDNILNFWDSLRVVYNIKNNGTETATFKVSLVINGAKGETISSVLQPESLHSFTKTFRFTQYGTNDIGITLDTTDCDTSDNSIYFQYTYGQPTLIINELTYKGIEWLELYNISEWKMHLRNFKICDPSTCSKGIFRDVEPGGFLVVSGDTNFKNLFPEVDYLYLSNFPRFNDSGDDIVLKSENFTIDSLHYSSSFGGGYNKSLERVSPYISTNEPSNWGTTQDPKGGTPGRINSLSYGNISSGISLPKKVYKKGEKLVLSFGYEFKVEELRVKIYDDLGRLVKEQTFKPNSPKGQVAVDTDDLWRGFYFLVVNVKGEKSAKVKIPFALKPF